MSDQRPLESLPATLPARGGVCLLLAAGIADGADTSRAPGALLLEARPLEDLPGTVPAGCARASWRVLAAGTPAEVAGHPGAADAATIRMPSAVLLPGLVNAHTHLDLTHLGPVPFDAERGFMGWIDMVRRGRHADEGSIEASVSLGIELSLANGVVAVGDIAGAPAAWPSPVPGRVLGRSALRGTSFLEFFAIGEGQERGIARAGAVLDACGELGGGVRPGLQPHAPNTVSIEAYVWGVEAAGRAGVPLSTHVAETMIEREFIRDGRGPQRGLLEALGLWNEHVAGSVGHGRSPVGHLRPALERARFLLAHANDLSDEDVSILAGTGQAVAYCPRAADYFGNPRVLGPHRYAELLDRGVTVALGTDSVVNLPAPAPGQRPTLGTLDEMRHLHARDGTVARTLLAMGTIYGARALGLDERAFTFAPGAELAGLVAVEVGSSPPIADAARAALACGAPPRLLALGR